MKEGCLVRYAGAKHRCPQITTIINELLPKNGVYWEPFVGSCAVLEGVHSRHRYASDINGPIINLMRAVQNGWNPPTRVTKKDHTKWKKRKWTSDDPLVGFIGFGCCFGGGFFCGFAGEEYAAQTRRSLIRQKPLLKGVNFRRQSYHKGFFGSDECPDLIYCDPPYDNTFQLRAKKRFNSDKFWEWAYAQARHSIVLVSEYDCPIDGVEVLWQRTLAKGLGTKADMDKGRKGTKVEKLYLIRRDKGPTVTIGLGL